jgi:glyoxylase-like metal-dependent hydrolase (beta-lactamase superfamily II)/rhodanese-related sulfurtransferase
MRRLFIASLLWATLVTAPQAQTQPSGPELLEQINPQIENINTAELKRRLQENPNLYVIDVRSADEINTLGGTIDAAQSINIPRGWLEFRIEENVRSKEDPIVVFCGVNQRSPLAAKTLMDMGYTNVANYEDGFFQWRDAGNPVEVPDHAPNSILYRLPQQVTDNVYSAIGATAPPSYENSGHNNNLSFIVTSEGVVVMNASDNALLARALHEEIRKVTDQPVKYVVLENAQGHAMLGSHYWQEQGAQIVAHELAAAKMKKQGEDILERMQRGRRDKALGTELTEPDIVFSEEWAIDLGGERFEAKYIGPAHGPGDILLWLPKQKLVITGDIAFHERLLPVFEDTDTAGWLETWENLEALEAEIVIPGHGGPTNMAEVKKYTVDYIAYMRSEIGQIIENMGGLQEAYNIDQSAYAHLDTFRELSRQNADRIFRMMEFEF